MPVLCHWQCQCNCAVLLISACAQVVFSLTSLNNMQVNLKKIFTFSFEADDVKLHSNITVPNIDLRELSI